MKEEKNSMKNNSNGLLIFIAVLLVILIAMGGFMIYTQYQNAPSDNSEQNEVIDDTVNNEIDSSQTQKVEELEMNSELAELMVNRLSSFNWSSYIYAYDLTDGNNEYFGLLYKQDKLLAKNLPSEVKSHFVVDNIYDYNHVDGCYYEISKEYYKEAYHKLLGKDISFEVVSYEFALPLLKSKGTKIELGHCGGDTVGPGHLIYKKFVRAEYTTDEIYLYEKIAIADTSDENTDKYDYYSNVNYSNKIIENVSSEEIFSTQYIDKLPEYKYTFKFEDGNYYFYGIEKVK